MSRNESFGADVPPETASGTLRKLGYSEDEIGATAHALPDSMGTEDKLRTSLRALSSNHTEQVQERHFAAANVDQIPAKNAKIADTPPDNSDYWQGRKDQQEDNKQNKPPKSATPRNPRQPRPPRAATVRQVDPATKALKQMKQMQKMARLLGGKKR